MKTTIITLIFIVLLGLGIAYMWDKPVTNPNVLKKLGMNATSTSTSTDTQGSTVKLTYTSKIFSLSYPQEMELQKTTDPTILFEGLLPRSLQPGTNFSDAKLDVKRDASPTAKAACLKATNGETAAGSATLSGLSFSKFNLLDAGAGNLYDTTSYRTLYGGYCYILEYTIHSTNIGNYPPEAGIKEYDKGMITDLLEGVVQSLVLQK